MDRFEELRTLVAVVESGSVSAAADRLDLAKSGVSRRLADLETRLGTELVRRTTRRLDITEAGRRLYERALTLLGDLDAAEDAVREDDGALVGPLRVAAPLTFGLLHLGPAVQAFLARHPGVNVDLQLDDAHTDLVAAGADVALRIARLPDSTLVARRLARIRHCVCAAPAYLETSGRPVRPEDLVRHRCVLYTNATDRSWRYRDAGGAEGAVTVTGPLAINNGEAMADAASAGLGLVLLPTFIVWRHLADGRLVTVLDDCAWPELDAWAIWPSTRVLSRRVRAFVDFLVEWMGPDADRESPYWDATGSQAGPRLP